MAITYRKFRLETDQELLLSLVECYRDVFAGSPWNEFWPVETVIRDLKHELTSDASCWLAMDNQHIVGFSWNYPMLIENLEAKLELAGVAQAVHGMTNQPNVSYLDEIGVIALYRGRGIARRLYDIHVDELRRSAKVSLLVARTKMQPPTIVYHWFTRIGYSVIAQYGETDGRVILAKPIQ